MKIYQAVEKLDENEMDKIGVIIDSAVEEENPEQLEGEDQDQVAELPGDEEQEDQMTSVSQAQPSPS